MALELSDYWPALGQDATTQRPRVAYCANEVFVGVLNRALDLPRLVCRYPWLEFDPRTFAAAKCHFEDPRMTLLIFDTGRVVAVGGTSAYATRYALTKLAWLLRNDYPGLSLREVGMQNFTCTVDLGFAVDVRRCARERPGKCETLLELFPGMHVRVYYGENKVSTVRHIVFEEGNIVVTGAHTREEAGESLVVAIPFYHEFRVERGGSRKPDPGVRAAVDKAVQKEVNAILRKFRR